MENSPRLTIGNNKQEMAMENEYLSTKHDLVANLRTVFKKPLNPDGTYNGVLTSNSKIRKN